MKKRILTVLICLILISGITWKVVSDNKKQNYYVKLKENMQGDIERVLYVIYPHCEVGKANYGILFEAEQNDYYGVDKKKLLDIDGESYCKVRAKARCISEGKLEWDTYIKCNDYEDDGYSVEK